MMPQPTILQMIFERKKMRVEAAKTGFEYAEFVNRAKNFRKDKEPYKFRKAFEDVSGFNIIAEIKRASPSKGVICENPDIGKIACAYETFGAKAISVLTEEDFFNGRIEDLLTAKNLTDLPVLRKDFIFDEFQVYESALIGADAVLLIVAMLSDEELKNLFELADQLGLDVLVETHDPAELERAKKLGAKLIGVNNRNLHTFGVSLDVSRELIQSAPVDALMICESGLNRKEDLEEMKMLGFGGFLIGESLMRADDLKVKFGELTT
jgi:indole-3-glycerol phosphate synthase